MRCGSAVMRQMVVEGEEFRAWGTGRRRGLNFLSLMMCVLVVRESQIGVDSSVSFSSESEVSFSRLCLPEAVVLAASLALMCARSALEAFNVCVLLALAHAKIPFPSTLGEVRGALLTCAESS